MIRPPDWLQEDARACWHRVQSRLLARGAWENIDASGLAVLSWSCSRYLSFARSIRKLENVQPDALSEMERTLEATRRLARMSLAEYPVIPHERVLFAVMNADNLDRDIANLCAPLDADLARMN